VSSTDIIDNGKRQVAAALDGRSTENRHFWLANAALCFDPKSTILLQQQVSVLSARMLDGNRK
jgi:hypothetical protein